MAPTNPLATPCCADAVTIESQRFLTALQTLNSTAMSIKGTTARYLHGVHSRMPAVLAAEAEAARAEAAKARATQGSATQASSTHTGKSGRGHGSSGTRVGHSEAASGGGLSPAVRAILQEANADVPDGDMSAFGMSATNRHVVVIEVFSHEVQQAYSLLCAE